MVLDGRRYSLPRRPAQLSGLAAETPALLPMLIVLAVLVALAADEAGFAPTSWYPATLVALALLLVTVLVLGPPARLPRAMAIALALFAAFTAWTYLSILWADRQGDALDGANRTLLYLLVLTLIAGWPVGPRAARIAIGEIGLGIAAVGLAELLRVNASHTPITFFLEGRLVEPAGYVNANVAIWTVGLIACLSLAAPREVPVPIRSLALGGAGILASMALLGQSRGWLITLPPALIVFVALCPYRLRAATAVLAVGGMTAIVSGRLLAVHDHFDPTRLNELVADALAATLTSAIVLALAGAAAAIVDRGRTPRPRPESRYRPSRSVWVGAAVIVLVALAVGLASGDRLSNAWSDFKKGGEPTAGSSRFTSLGTYRYDFWRIAWDVFEEHPVAGVGADNYQAEYLRRGRGYESPRYAHSLELGVLSQTGLVGALLLLGALGCALWAALARRRRAPDAWAWISAGGLGIFVYWLLHASLDWLWEFPALAGLAFGAIGLAAAPSAAATIRSRRRVTRPLAVVCGATALVAAVALAAPWLAERETRRAIDTWRTDPAAAYERLDRAASLNPLATRPHTVAGTIAASRGDLDRAQSAFEDALAVEPDNAYAALELGAIAAQRGDRRRALDLLRRARRAQPRDPPTAYAYDRTVAGKALTLAAVNSRILAQSRARVQRSP
jgi:tetratricopeptide (TPR) repeat protein